MIHFFLYADEKAKICPPDLTREVAPQGDWKWESGAQKWDHPVGG